MTGKQTTRNLLIALLGLAIGALIASATGTGTRTGLAHGNGNGLGLAQDAAPHSQDAQTANAPPERNKAILELEKKIAGQEDKPAEEVFKNIQILKGRPAGQVLKIMEFGFNPALGVKCGFCHVMDQWDKDDRKHKVVARKMMTLTSNINKEVKEMTDEKAAVSCYSCHHGQEKPALSPQPMKPPASAHEHSE